MSSQDTETKPSTLPVMVGGTHVLRLVFSGFRACLPARTVRVSPAGLCVGRDVAIGIRFGDDARMSRHHATFTVDASGALEVADEQSKNGTWVNGQREARARLKLGDVISLGDTTFVVANERPPEAIAPESALIGDSAPMWLVREAIAKLGTSRSTVLLTAETGCGKELAARALHLASQVRGEFVAVNCAAVPDNLFEAQFFGYRTGAFTGAVAHEGFFRAAHGGTLFLDEVGELPLAQQPKLLRAIQDRAVVPLGSTRPIACDVRIIAATNRNLARDVEEGRFRADLLARLFDTQIALPPVRERRDDILQLFAQAFGAPPPPMTHALAEALLLHDWRFNVRELLATARQMAVEIPPNGVLDLPAFQRRLNAASGPNAVHLVREPRRKPRSDVAQLDVLELSRVLARNRGSIARVAREVGRSRRQVYRWIEKHGIDVNLFRDPNRTASK